MVSPTPRHRTRVLSPLQERVAAIVAGLDEAEGFALAGGAALILLGQVYRQTRDLDFYGLSPADVDRLAPAAIAALRNAGLTVHVVRENLASFGSSSTPAATAPSSTWQLMLGSFQPSQARSPRPCRRRSSRQTRSWPSSPGQRHATSSTSLRLKAVMGCGG